MIRMTFRVKSFARSNSINIVSFFIALVIFGIGFATNPERPGVTTPNGYRGFWDQSQYLNEATILSHGQLPAKGAYQYPLGYPLIGAVSLKVDKSIDPFVIPDALMFAATIALLVALGRRVRSTAFGLGCATLVVVASPLLRQSTVPWSTTLTAFGVMACLMLVTDNKFGWKHGLAFGAVVALVFAARFQDGLVLALFGLYPLIRYKAKAIIPLAIGAFISLGSIAGVMYSQNRAFGDPFTTPYSQHYGLRDNIADQSPDAYHARSIPAHFVEMFLTANDANGNRQPGNPLLVDSLWLLLTPIGFLALLLRKNPLKEQLIVAFVLSVISTCFYLSFRSSDGGGIQYNLLHYFKAWLPVWSIFAGLGALWLLELSDRFSQKPAPVLSS